MNLKEGRDWGLGCQWYGQQWQIEIQVEQRPVLENEDDMDTKVVPPNYRGSEIRK